MKDIRMNLFCLTGIIALVTTLITVGFQSWKASIKNPVDVLRYA